MKNMIEYNKGTRNKTRQQKLGMPDNELNILNDNQVNII